MVLTPSSSLPRALARLSAKSPLCRASAYAESCALGKDLFAESICSPRVTVGKFRVCREPDRMLSANFKALGKSSVSRSVRIRSISNFTFEAGTRRLENANSKFVMGIARASGRLGRSPTDWWRRPRSSPLKPASATQAQAYKRRALPPSQGDTPLAHRDTI